MPPEPATYRRHRFPAEVISRAVWLYHAFSLSRRAVDQHDAVPDILVQERQGGQALLSAAAREP